VGLSYFIKSIFCVALAFVVSCSPASNIDQELSPKALDQYQRKLALTLKNPNKRTELIAKVFGSTVEEERHAFLKFHIFGFAGDGNLIPFFSMNNYVVQQWVPGEDSTYELQHYEVAYYSKFDSTEPLDEWKNPLTGETITLPHFVLGPVYRAYSPDMAEGNSSFAPDPLNITMIGDRVYIPTLSKFEFQNPLSVEEWGPYSNGTTTFWDSMLVYSADVKDVFDDTKVKVDADIHMQNLISWAPYLKLGQSPGRTMVRAYGQHISGYDALPKDIRANLEKYTPEIFDLESWTDVRLDSIELAQKLAAERAAGTLDIDQPDYVPFKVKKFDELME
tara:strand:- start:2149 stop:3150 length:1002 start_codon:yes stop_codon:yes gene_type:complete